MSELNLDIGYADYLSLNKGGVSKFKYLYRTKESRQLHRDFMSIFASLYDPTIFFQEGGYFVAENYSQVRYDEAAAQAENVQEISYWLNMVEITSLFGDISYDEAVKIGGVVCGCWSAKLNLKYPDSGFEARLISDDELDEVWVTLCSG
ncbi:hypothetical protein [Pseudomonas viridiflava]|uniref:hypothetical protein n=2 Tax=Pseudomonas viridiflava TaxID=33069 RepID=UPI002ECD2EAB|nr:hypothetical protein [Pseudomonas viridiflava]